MVIRGGATVWTVVAGPLIGEALHRLEYHADVHLLDRWRKSDDDEVWRLRSLEFPPAWDGRRVALLCQTGVGGIFEFEVQAAR